MKLLVETQTQSDEGIWKPLQVLADPEYNKIVKNSLFLFDETETSKYYIDWYTKTLVKVTAVDKPDAV